MKKGKMPNKALKPSCIAIGCAAGLTAIGTLPLQGANVWNGQGDWGNAANWSAGVPADGQDVVIGAGSVRLDSATPRLASYTVNAGATNILGAWDAVIRADSVEIGGTLTHVENTATNHIDGEWTPNARIRIECRDFTLLAGGLLDGVGKGFGGGDRARGCGLGFGDGGRDSGSGGGYGATGGNNVSHLNRAWGGVPYGSASAPDLPGSGGGGRYGDNFPSKGGRGGGLVQIAASGGVVIDGAIRVDGADGEGMSPGGGSGGGVHISCATFSGKGEVSANGGKLFVGGGGGRIAVEISGMEAQRALSPSVALSASTSRTGPGTFGYDGTIEVSDARLMPPADRHSRPSVAFARGADVSWLPQMEAMGWKFRDADGTEKDCLELLRDRGVNSIRLRVFVNPSDNPYNGHCSPEETVKMAKRCADMGFRVMIDFHYGDSWADPGTQNYPAAWKGMSMDDLAKAVYDHTFSVLTKMKEAGVTPEWVQVGNEIMYGMFWPDCGTDKWPNLAKMLNSGHDAIKAVDPDIKVVLHLHHAAEEYPFLRWFREAISHGVRFDVAGTSAYTSPDNWDVVIDRVLSTLNSAIREFGKDVMVCEVGMGFDREVECGEMLAAFIAKADANMQARGLGVFYWEPQCYNWANYQMGAWRSDGTPSPALDSYRDVPRRKEFLKTIRPGSPIFIAQGLAAKHAAIAKLNEAIRENGAEDARVMALESLSKRFAGQAQADVDNGNSARVVLNAEFLVGALEDAEAYAKRIVENPAQADRIIRIEPDSLRLSGGGYVTADGAPVFLWGPHLYWYLRSDMAEVWKLGFNSVLAEVIAKASEEERTQYLDGYRSNGVHVNAERDRLDVAAALALEPRNGRIAYDGDAWHGGIALLDLIRSAAPDAVAVNNVAYMLEQPNIMPAVATWRLALHGLAEGNWAYWHSNPAFCDMISNPTNLFPLVMSWLDLKRQYNPAVYKLSRKAPPVCVLVPDALPQEAGFPDGISHVVAPALCSLGMQPRYANSKRIAAGMLGDYAALAMPRSTNLGDATRGKVAEFVKKGGRLIVEGGGLPQGLSGELEPVAGLDVEAAGAHVRSLREGSGEIWVMDIPDGSDVAARRMAWRNVVAAAVNKAGKHDTVRLSAASAASVALDGVEWRSAEVDGAYVLCVLPYRGAELDGLKLEADRPVKKIVDMIGGAEISPDGFRIGSGPNLFRIDLAR